jgi:ATP-dependent DNA helicase RecG
MYLKITIRSDKRGFVMIEEILKSNEGKTLEFKENLRSLPGIIKTIIAFANTAGGTIVIGVEDGTKKIVGVSDPLAEEERLASVINDSIAPLLMPDIDIQSYGNKELIIINVPHVTGPCYLKSAGLEKGTYIRLGSTNRVVDDETLISLKNFAKNVYFDELPYLQGKISDLDWDFIKTLFQRVDKKITMHNAQSIGLIKQQGTKEYPSYGGIVLFGINRLALFPEAIIRCARFLGDDKDTLLDRADIEIYLPLALEEAIKFIQRNTSLSSEIKELGRKDIPQYPLVALREAIVNAIVHADYAMKGVYISIAIFDERIEITNPGGLPFGFTIEKALAGSSRIRNRVIAKVFYHMKWVEQWGSGLRRIIKECAQRDLEEPKFEELNNQFRVTLYAKKKEHIILGPWHKELISYLKKKGKISTKEAAALWQVTARTARNRLIKIVDAGIIKKVGLNLKDPQSSYILVDKVK